MSEATNQWSLFGLDTRHLAQQWLGAWRGFLFAAHAPLRRRLDEPVSLSAPGVEPRIYQGGAPCATVQAPADACQARLLPDELALTRSLILPGGVEAELSAVVAMEIRASSPFSDEDTVSGWCESARDERGIEIHLAIASRSAVHHWLKEQQIDGPVPEVWVAAGHSMVVLNGFGEARREAAYRRRLLRCAGLFAGVLAVSLLMALLLVIHQRSLLAQREAQFAQLQTRAAAVVASRSRMVAANDTAERADALAAQHPNPHCELVRLTALLDDQAYIQSFQMRGLELALRGTAEDAAGVMQRMAEASDYQEVSAPQPIRPAGGGRELFYIDLKLRENAPGRCA